MLTMRRTVALGVRMWTGLAIEKSNCLQQNAVFTVSTPSKPQVKEAVVHVELCVGAKSLACQSNVFIRKTTTQVFAKS
jgi:hypothetical protein